MLLPILAFTAIIVFLIYATKGKTPRGPAEDQIAGNPFLTADWEMQKKIDLHHRGFNFPVGRKYVEFSFYGPFGEVFNIEWMGANPELTGWELFEILKTLNIPYDRELIIDKYEGNSVEVFHCTDDEMTFAYFDLRREPTDQMRMFFFGLSCRQEDEKMIHEKLLDIYRKLYTSSAFSFDMRNNDLYNKTFRSYFYFYQNNYNESKAQLKHHNL